MFFDFVKILKIWAWVNIHFFSTCIGLSVCKFSCFSLKVHNYLFFLSGSSFTNTGLEGNHEKYPYSGFFWFVFSHIVTEYVEILCIRRDISPYLVRMRENTDQKNSEYWHFSGIAVRVLCPPGNTRKLGIFWFSDVFKKYENRALAWNAGMQPGIFQGKGNFFE